MRSVRRELLRLKARRLLGRWDAVPFGNFTVVRSKGVKVGANCAINHGVFILGRTGVTIGNDVVLSAHCMLLDATLDPETFGDGKKRTYKDAPIKIEDGAWIGAGAIILAGVTVGRNSVVGAGSVVTRDVPPSSVVAGNPARVIKTIGEAKR